MIPFDGIINGSCFIHDPFIGLWPADGIVSFKETIHSSICYRWIIRGLTVVPRIISSFNENEEIDGSWDPSVHLVDEPFVLQNESSIMRSQEHDRWKQTNNVCFMKHVSWHVSYSSVFFSCSMEIWCVKDEQEKVKTEDEYFLYLFHNLISLIFLFQLNEGKTIERRWVLRNKKKEIHEIRKRRKDILVLDRRSG